MKSMDVEQIRKVLHLIVIMGVALLAALYCAASALQMLGHPATAAEAVDAISAYLGEPDE
jgi:hypothetical protein